MGTVFGLFPEISFVLVHIFEQDRFHMDVYLVGQTGDHIFELGDLLIDKLPQFLAFLSFLHQHLLQVLLFLVSHLQSLLKLSDLFNMPLLHSLNILMLGLFFIPLDVL